MKEKEYMIFNKDIYDLIVKKKHKKKYTKRFNMAYSSSRTERPI